MQRETLRERFGTLDDQLEKLEWLARQNDIAVLDPKVKLRTDLMQQLQNAHGVLQDLKERVVDELTSQRTVSAESLLTKLAHFAIEESNKQNIELSLSLFASGKISMQSAELVMGAMVPVVRASISGLCSESVERRRKKHLFAGACLGLELRAEDSGIFFKVQDDGPGLKNSKSTRGIREYVSKQAGWCSFFSFPIYGGKIELRLPISQGRTEAITMPIGGTALAFPFSCLREANGISYLKNVKRVDGFYSIEYKGEFVPLCVFEPEFGLRPLDTFNEQEPYPNLCIIGAADFALAILCDGSPSKSELRLMVNSDWFVEDSWFQLLGSYRDGDKEILLPYIDGSILMKMYKQYWGTSK